MGKSIRQRFSAGHIIKKSLKKPSRAGRSHPLSRPAVTSSSKTASTTNSLTRAEVEEIVKMVRLRLYNQGLFCGAQAIQGELEQLHVRPLPSLTTIKRILSRHELTYARTGHYP